jgi:hypothetical protein
MRIILSFHVVSTHERLRFWEIDTWVVISRHAQLESDFTGGSTPYNTGDFAAKA